MKITTVLQKTVISTLVCVLSLCQTTHTKTEEFELGYNELESIKQLYSLIEKSSPTEQQQAAKIIVKKLKAEHATIAAQEQDLLALDSPLPRDFYHKQFINKQRILYFDTILTQDTSWKHFFMNALQSAVDQCAYAFSYIFGTGQPSLVDQLVAAVDAYFIIEDNEILYNPAGVAHITALVQKNKMPAFIAVWKDPSSAQELLLRVQRLDKVRIQMASNIKMAINAFALGITFAAGQSAIDQAEKEFATNMENLRAQQKKISENLSNSGKKLQADKEEAFGLLQTSFQESYSQVMNEQNRTIQLFEKEIQYLNKSVVSFENPLAFLSNLNAAQEMDTAFEASIMLTPTANNGPIWYNPFQAGDWQFDGQTKSFWQHELNPMPTPFVWDNPTAGYDPARYSIFTEYMHPEQTSLYTIKLDLELINCTWPFFAGIMFNKARWISGNAEAETQYRLLGIYGSQSDPQNQSTRKLSLCFAQQKITITLDAQGKKTITITTPLEEIVKGSGITLYSFENNSATANDAQQIDRNPAQYTLTIKTSPTIVDWAFEKIDADKKNISLANNKIENLTATLGTASDSPRYSLFKYHGIGYIATGCQAKFSLTEPVGLTYTSGQIDAFNKQLVTYLEKVKKEVTL